MSIVLEVNGHKVGIMTGRRNAVMWSDNWPALVTAVRSGDKRFSLHDVGNGSFGDTEIRVHGVIDPGLGGSL